VAPVTELLSQPVHYRTIETAGGDGETDMSMNKVIIALMAIYFLGDPGLQYLSWLGDMKLYIVAAAIALVSMPWIASQLDG
jgi:hypothetical protein